MMRVKVLSLVFTAAIGISALTGATAFAAAQPNGNGCNSRGVAISNYSQELRGPEISGIAQSAPGALADAVHGLQTCPAP